MRFVSSSSVNAGQRSIPARAGNRVHRQGQAHKPYGVKVSIATTIDHAKGGQFVTHVNALPGNPYDGHTLATGSRTWRR